MSFKYSACFTSYQIICRVMWDHMRFCIAAPKSGVELTENLAMWPAASVSGMLFELILYTN